MSEFVVSARKYRPLRFDDVVGQSHISHTLKNALKSDHLAHAFLFCGPRGVGKTTCARILAKLVNCENKTAEFEACNTCGPCKSFNENASFNIIELDAASNNGVENVRALTEQVRFPPQQGRYKVYIIDEVHMLSTAAFNAFLKTLEEPPPYAIFILATTEKQKIIPTILSRCQIYDFKRIQVADIAQHLKGICEKENIQAEPDALHIIAQKADGALRDALSIFDRIVSFSGKTLTYDDVISNLNILDYDYFFKTIDALMASDVASILLQFDQIQQKGFEADTFILGLAEHIRNLLVCKDSRTHMLLDAGEALTERYFQQAIITPISLLLTALNICNECDIHFKMARNKRLHVEMALIKMTYIQYAVDLSKKSLLTESTEKKNLDLTATPPKQYEAPPQAINKVAEKVELGKPIELEVKKGESTTIKPIIKKTSLLDSIHEEVSNNASLGKKEEELTLEKANQIINGYLKEIAGNDLVAIFQDAKISVTENKQFLVITVGSTLQKGILEEEPTLKPYFHQSIDNEKVYIRIDIDTSLKPINTDAPKPFVPLTDREKYQKMVEQNNVLETLRQKFDLRFDEN